MEKKFASLAQTANLIKFFGRLLSVVGVLLSVAFFVYSSNSYEAYTLSEYLLLALMILISVVIGTIVFAIGQFIECIMSIEENTRKPIDNPKSDNVYESA